MFRVSFCFVVEVVFFVGFYWFFLGGRVFVELFVFGSFEYSEVVC